MLTNNSHENYDKTFQALYEQVDDLAEKMKQEYMNVKEKSLSKEKIYKDIKYFQLLEQGLKSLREQNDYEASLLAATKCCPTIIVFIRAANILFNKDQSIYFSEFNQVIDIYWSMVSVAARYSLHFFIEYMFHDKKKQPYKARKDLLAPAVFYIGRGLLNQLHLKLKKYDNVVPPKTILFSTFPSSGKTLVANYGQAWIKCLAMIKIRGGGMLRIGNEENNVGVNSQSIKDIISDTNILDVFPEMDCMRDVNGKYSPFEKDRLDEWYLKEDREEPRRASFRTSGSATNGIRINIALVIDDPSRGMVDRNNVEIHNKIISSYNGDWLSRFDNEEDSFVLLIGTRFNNFDVFSSVQANAERKGLVEDTRFKGVLKSIDGKTVIINIDCENEKGKSRYPSLISDDTLEDKRNSMSRQEYFCVYRQMPIPEDGLDFDYSVLNLYDEKYSQNQLEDRGVCAIDPTRKSGADYLSIPILKKCIDKKDKWYGYYIFCDCVFRKKSIKDDETFKLVLKKIIDNNVKKIDLEVNTDTSLGQRMKDNFEPLNYAVKINEVYNTVPKAQRIADESTLIIKKIVFPKQGLYLRNTDMGEFMEQFTMYTSSKKNAHDDAPDSMAMVCKHEIDGTIGKNTLKFFNKSLG